MGTIYRHNVTADEIKSLRRIIPGRRIDNRDDYEKTMNEDLKYADLFRLYMIRGEKERAMNYYDKIEDKVLRYLLKGH